MSHVYETFVDIKEYGQQTGVAPQIYSERYEIAGDSRATVETTALTKAENVHPKACEFSVRVTRMLQ
jgi:hypothetical protein